MTNKTLKKYKSIKKTGWKFRKNAQNPWCY